VFVRTGGPSQRAVRDDLIPLQGSDGEIADGLRSIVEAGADEVIVVADPITEASIEQVGGVLEAVRS